MNSAVTGQGRPTRIPATAFGLVVGLWAVFAATVLLDPAQLERWWDTLRTLPLIPQAVGWIALFPWVIATLIWITSWALWVRVALIGIIVLATLVGFSPRTEQR